ncbi:MAG: hypothetical protein ACK53L_24380, partial [Pirellulaceae bacterium]
MDAHKHAGHEEPDEQCWEDFGPDQKMYLVRREGEDWSRKSRGEAVQETVFKHVDEEKTIRRQPAREARVNILVKAIIQASKSNVITEQLARDCYSKAKEEVMESATDQMGQPGKDEKNLSIIRKFFDYEDLQPTLPVGFDAVTATVVKEILNKVTNWRSCCQRKGRYP